MPGNYQENYLEAIRHMNQQLKKRGMESHSRITNMGGHKVMGINTRTI